MEAAAALARPLPCSSNCGGCPALCSTASTCRSRYSLSNMRRWLPADGLPRSLRRRSATACAPPAWSSTSGRATVSATPEYRPRNWRCTVSCPTTLPAYSRRRLSGSASPPARTTVCCAWRERSLIWPAARPSSPSILPRPYSTARSTVRPPIDPLPRGGLWKSLCVL